MTIEVSGLGPGREPWLGRATWKPRYRDIRRLSRTSRDVINAQLLAKARVDVTDLPGIGDLINDNNTYAGINRGHGWQCLVPPRSSTATARRLRRVVTIARWRT
ncbi:MAG: hypothetical protein M5T61_09805 [Acidimicrobiia bacterium]|nr:hypothetical protein [Acidimicrobiia bacterium]